MSFHRGSSSGTGGGDGPSAWPSSLSMPETEELYRFGLLVPPGCRLSHDWKLDKDGYPRRGPGATAEEKRTGGRNNIAGRHAFWDGKDYAAVIRARRLAESGGTADLVSRPRPEARGRRAPPPPAPATADPPAPPEVELPPEQLVLREDGDPDDTPGYLVALRASVAAAAATEAAATAREAAEEAAAIQAAAAIPPVVPQAEAEAAESSDEDDIDWEWLAQVSDDDDDDNDGGGDGAVIDLLGSDDEDE
ncbi:hypothetical protein ACQJBY_034173 [Aegilops geniculata]